MRRRLSFIIASFLLIAGLGGRAQGEPLRGYRCFIAFASESGRALLRGRDGRELDDSAAERGIMGLVAKLKREKDSGLVEGFAQGQPVAGQLSPAERAQRPDPEDSISSQLMAPLGHLFGLQMEPGAKKATVIKKEENFARLKTETEKQLARLPKDVSPEFKTYLQSVLDLRVLPSGDILVNVNMARPSPGDPFASFVRDRMATSYIYLVAWIYRWKGLEPNQTLTNARMIDEIVTYAKKGYGFHFHMAFDAKVWAIQERSLHSMWLQYRQGALPKDTPHWAFLPFAGVVSAEPLLDPALPVEMKRYFGNPWEDPFEIVGVSQKEDNKRRLHMLSSIVTELPSGTVIDAHAHERDLVRLYQFYGFTNMGVAVNEKFPDAKVTVMRGTREGALQRAAELLGVRSERESSSSGH